MKPYGRNMAMRLLRKITFRKLLKGGWVRNRSDECAEAHWNALIASVLADRGLHTFTQAQFEAERTYLASL